MGGDNSKSKPILKYYVFQKKINKYLNNQIGNRPYKNSIKIGYIVNPEWIKEWKKAINYKKISFFCNEFKIESSEKLTENQKLLVQEFIEKYYQNRNIFIKTSSFISKTHLTYIYNKNMSNYWETFVNEKTFKLLNINKNNTVEQLKYIFKRKLLILFFKSHLLMKMALHKNQLINLTIAFFDIQTFEKYKEYFKEAESEEIMSFLKKKNIFSTHYYEYINKNYNLIYIIRNESFNKNNYQITNIIKPEKIDFELIKRVSYRGLDNVGATCYMNATLQCLANIKPITHYLLDPNNYSDLYSNESLCRLTLSYSQVLIGLYLNKSIEGSYSPNNFKYIISEYNPLFKGVQANDSKDLIIFLLEIINNELVKIHNKKNNPKLASKTIIDKGVQFLDISNEKIIFDNFQGNFNKTHCSIIGKILCGFNKSVFECQNCGKFAFNFNIYNFLIFGLEAISNYFNLSNNNTMMPIINFEHCFQFLSKEENFQNTYCQNCYQTTNSKYKESLYTMPDYLIIILNRGKGNIFKCHVIVPENFNASYYVEKKINFKETYELVGIVSHLGESGMGGHFIAFCKHNIDNKWRCYNDSIVTECNNDYLNKGTPYILFYKKDKIERNVNIINLLNMNSQNGNNFLNNMYNNNFQKNNNNINFKININSNSNKIMNNKNMINNNMNNNMIKNMNNNINNNNVINNNMNYNNMNYNMINNNNMNNKIMNNNIMNNMINNNIINNTIMNNMNNNIINYNMMNNNIMNNNNINNNKIINNNMINNMSNNILNNNMMNNNTNNNMMNNIIMNNNIMINNNMMNNNMINNNMNFNMMNNNMNFNLMNCMN